MAIALLATLGITSIEGKSRYQKAKDWAAQHKKVLIGGATAAGVAALGAGVLGTKAYGKRKQIQENEQLFISKTHDLIMNLQGHLINYVNLEDPENGEKITRAVKRAIGELEAKANENPTWYALAVEDFKEKNPALTQGISFGLIDFIPSRTLGF